MGRALADPSQRARWTSSPVDALLADGVQVRGEDIKRWMGLEGATDGELVQVLSARLATRVVADMDSGCGCSCSVPVPALGQQDKALS